MHSSLIVLTILAAIVWRWTWGRTPPGPDRTWQDRWESALGAFCLPPLMVVLAAATVLAMGHHGTMMGWSVSPMGCWISLAMIVFAGGGLLYSVSRAVGMWLTLQRYATVTLPQGGQARCLPIDLPMAAQVGLWRSALLVSQGWLDQLTLAEQQAMLAHEQAHADYHDPFWFFWLGSIRRFSLWLPHTEGLWKELLLLREIRADQQAARTSDPLLLAELLVKLARQITLATHAPGLAPGLESYTAFPESQSLPRLEQRVRALVEPSPRGETYIPRPGRLAWLIVTALPLAATWFHT